MIFEKRFEEIVAIALDKTLLEEVKNRARGGLNKKKISTNISNGNVDRTTVIKIQGGSVTAIRQWSAPVGWKKRREIGDL